jgi:hypothetical protein
MVVLEIALLTWLQDRHASHHAMLVTLILDQRHVPQEISNQQHATPTPVTQAQPLSMVVLELAKLLCGQDGHASHHATLDTLYLDQHRVPPEL